MTQHRIKHKKERHLKEEFSDGKCSWCKMYWFILKVNKSTNKITSQMLRPSHTLKTESANSSLQNFHPQHIKWPNRLSCVRFRSLVRLRASHGTIFALLIRKPSFARWWWWWKLLDTDAGQHFSRKRERKQKKAAVRFFHHWSCSKTRLATDESPLRDGPIKRV